MRLEPTTYHQRCGEARSVSPPEQDASSAGREDHATARVNMQRILQGQMRAAGTGRGELHLEAEAIGGHGKDLDMAASR